MSRRLFSAGLVAAALACSACNNNGQYPVSGKGTYHGEPAAGATVTFIRKGSADRFAETTPQGVVQEDGTFTLSGPAGNGAPPGEYAVLVEWKEGAGAKRGRAPALNAPDRLKRKYLDADKPLLTATVEPKTNALPPFELK